MDVRDGDSSDPASVLFDQFVAANTYKAITTTFQQLCDYLDLKPHVDHWSFYRKLRARLTSWKAQSLWTKLDKRASHREYKKQTACENTRVLIIGAGPCGMRTAIEMALLGAKCVIVEKRDRFSRNNVIHLWPYLIYDLKALGGKKFFGKFCAGAIDHISIRTLQCMMLKIVLLLGIEVHDNVSFEGLVEPPEDQNERVGWRAKVQPADHPASLYEFDVLVGADGRRNTLDGFKRKEFRGKLALAITANFINRFTQEEARVEEISGVAFIFNQKFFQDLKEKTNIDLENIVYYKDETHYFVMTAKKQSLLRKGVLRYDYSETSQLLSPNNVNQERLMGYAMEAAYESTNNMLPNLEFAKNHYGKPDVAMFDFTSIFSSENACRVVQRHGHKLLMSLVGDSLLEPFWPTGTGCARGFMAGMDVAWMVKSWASGKKTTLEVIAERESIYQLLSQTTPENTSKNFSHYTIDPCTRYPNINTEVLKPIQIKHLYDPGDGTYQDELIELPAKKSRNYESQVDSYTLLKWCQRHLSPYKNMVKVTDLTTSWKNGLALCALIHLFRPDLINAFQLHPNEVSANNQMAFDTCEKEFGIPPVMTGEEMATCEVPDKLTMVSYLSQIYELFKKQRPVRIVKTPDKLSPDDIPTSRRPKSPSQRLSLLSRLSSRLARQRRERENFAQERRNEIEKIRIQALEKEREMIKISIKEREQTLRREMEWERKKKMIGQESSKEKPNSAWEGYTKKRIKDMEEGESPAILMDEQDGVQLMKYKKLDELDARISQLGKKAEPGNLANLDPGVRGKNKVSALAKGLASKFGPFSENAPAAAPPSAAKKPAPAKALAASSQGSDFCYFCKKRVYLVERYSAEGVFFHRGCLRCEYCSTNLRLGGYAFQRTDSGEAKFFCIQHLGMKRPERRRKRSFKDAEVEENIPPICPLDKLMHPDLSPPAASSPIRGAGAQRGLKQTPERVEFETSFYDDDDAAELTEDEQIEHNLRASFSTEFIDEDDLEDSDSDLETLETELSELSDAELWNFFGDDDDDDDDVNFSDGDHSLTWEEACRLAEKWNERHPREDGSSDSDSDSTTEVEEDTDSDDDTETEDIGESSHRPTPHIKITPDHARKEREGFDLNTQIGSPPAPKEKVPTPTSLEMARQRNNFFSMAAEPVRIDPFQFLGLKKKEQALLPKEEELPVSEETKEEEVEEVEEEREKEEGEIDVEEMKEEKEGSTEMEEEGEVTDETTTTPTPPGSDNIREVPIIVDENVDVSSSASSASSDSESEDDMGDRTPVSEETTLALNRSREKTPVSEESAATVISGAASAELLSSASSWSPEREEPMPEEIPKVLVSKPEEEEEEEAAAPENTTIEWSAEIEDKEKSLEGEPVLSSSSSHTSFTLPEDKPLKESTSSSSSSVEISKDSEKIPFEVRTASREPSLSSGSSEEFIPDSVEAQKEEKVESEEAIAVKSQLSTPSPDSEIAPPEQTSTPKEPTPSTSSGQESVSESDKVLTTASEEATSKESKSRETSPEVKEPEPPSSSSSSTETAASSSISHETTLPELSPKESSKEYAPTLESTPVAAAAPEESEERKPSLEAVSPVGQPGDQTWLMDSFALSESTIDLDDLMEDNVSSSSLGLSEVAVDVQSRSSSAIRTASPCSVPSSRGPSAEPALVLQPLEIGASAQPEKEKSDVVTPTTEPIIVNSPSESSSESRNSEVSSLDPSIAQEILESFQGADHIPNIATSPDTTTDPMVSSGSFYGSEEGILQLRAPLAVETDGDSAVDENTLLNDDDYMSDEPSDDAFQAEEKLVGERVSPVSSVCSLTDGQLSSASETTDKDSDIEPGAFRVDESYVTTRGRKKRYSKRQESRETDSSFTVSTPTDSANSSRSSLVMETEFNRNRAELSADISSLDNILDDNIDEMMEATMDIINDLDETLIREGGSRPDSVISAGGKDQDGEKSADVTNDSIYATPQAIISEEKIKTESLVPSEKEVVADKKVEEAELVPEELSLTEQEPITAEDLELPFDDLASKKDPRPLGRRTCFKELAGLYREPSPPPVHHVHAKRAFMMAPPEPVRIDPFNMYKNKTMSNGSVPKESDTGGGEPANANKKSPLDSSSLGDMEEEFNTPSKDVTMQEVLNGQHTPRNGGNEAFYTPATSMKTKPARTIHDTPSMEEPNPKDTRKRLLPDLPAQKSHVDISKKKFTVDEMRLLRETEREKARALARNRARLKSDDELGVVVTPKSKLVLSRTSSLQDDTPSKSTNGDSSRSSSEPRPAVERLDEVINNKNLPLSPKTEKITPRAKIVGDDITNIIPRSPRLAKDKVTAALPRGPILPRPVQKLYGPAAEAAAVAEAERKEREANEAKFKKPEAPKKKRTVITDPEFRAPLATSESLESPVSMVATAMQLENKAKKLETKKLEIPSEKARTLSTGSENSEADKYPTLSTVSDASTMSDSRSRSDTLDAKASTSEATSVSSAEKGEISPRETLSTSEKEDTPTNGRKWNPLDKKDKKKDRKSKIDDKPVSPGGAERGESPETSTPTSEEKKEKRRSFLDLLFPGKSKAKKSPKLESPTEETPPKGKSKIIKSPKSKEKKKKGKEKEKTKKGEDEIVDQVQRMDINRGPTKEDLINKMRVVMQAKPSTATGEGVVEQAAPKAMAEDFSDLESEFDDRLSIISGISGTSSIRGDRSRMTDEELNERLTRKVQKAAKRQQRLREMKRLRMAQEIQRQLQEVEVRHRQLEEQGVAVERALRGEGPEEEREEAEMMQEWFNVVNEKNMLVRYESELMVHAKELELEDRHSRLEQRLREKMAIDDESPITQQAKVWLETKKTSEETDEEKKILDELLEVVEQRDALVAMLEEDRLREREEDQDLRNMMMQKGFQLSPISFSKKGLNMGEGSSFSPSTSPKHFV